MGSRQRACEKEWGAGLADKIICYLFPFLFFFIKYPRRYWYLDSKCHVSEFACPFSLRFYKVGHFFILVATREGNFSLEDCIKIGVMLIL